MLYLLLNGALSFGQSRTIEVTSQQTSILSQPNHSTGECNLAINPANPDHLLLGILSAHPDPKVGAYHTLPLVSFNGGKTWQASSSKLPAAADPWCIITAKGAAVITDISAGSRFQLTTRYSPDGGLSWQDTIFFGAGYDHGMLLPDDSQGKYKGSMYMVATQSLQPGLTDIPILVARSSDGGKSFSQRSLIYPFRNVDLNAKTPIVFSDGTLAIPVLVRGGFSANEQKFLAFEQMQNWLITSKDGGNTFSNPLFIAGTSGRRHHLLAVNRAEKWKDQLSFVFAGPDRKGIFFTRSTDKGESWSDPIRIGQDTAAVPWTDLGAMAISRQGTIGIVYYVQVSSGSEKCYNTYFTASVDGGETFLAPVRLHAAQSCPGDENGWVKNAWPQGGDYCGLVARPDGSFLAVWSDARNGLFAPYSATLRIK